MKRAGHAALFGVLAMVSISSACASIVGFPEQRLRPVDDGGATTDDASTPDAANACDQTPLAARPPAETSSSADSEQIVLALRTLDVGTGNSDAPDVGLNLDGLCSCNGGPEACVPFSDKPICDDRGGIDNQAARFLKALTFSQKESLDARFNAAVNEGLLGLVIVISAYNGKADDFDVTVSVFRSTGTPLGTNGAHVAPEWRGQDTWELDPAGVVIGNRPPYLAKYTVTGAWITGGQLVASLDYEVPLVAEAVLGPLPVKLRRGIITGKLTRQDSVWGIENGILAGRWPTVELLRTMGAGRDPANESQRICKNTPVYLALKETICARADVPLRQEKGPAPDSCTAVSVGFGFTATQAKVGALGPAAAPEYVCPNAGDDCP